MPSNLELLRSGKAIEFEPGVSGRLNPQNKTLELSTGEILDASDDPDFFPQNAQALAISQEKEQIKKGLKGPISEFWHQYSTQGVPGGIRDWLEFAGNNYQAKKAAHQQVSEDISENSPFISAAATGANIATDLALTRGMSAFKAAPLLTAASAGSRIATEPTNVAAESALAGAGGYILDKGVNWLNNVAQRRAASRALPAQQQAVQAQNIAGQQATQAANAAQMQQFNAAKQAVSAQNLQANQNYQNQLVSRQNQILQNQNIFKQAQQQQNQQFIISKNNVNTINQQRLQQHQQQVQAQKHKFDQEMREYEQKKLARDNEIVRLKNEAELKKAERSKKAAKAEADYKNAVEAAEKEDKIIKQNFKKQQEQYEQELKNLPELQKKAQAEFSANVVKNAKEIENAFPKNSRFTTNDFQIENFIQDSIQKTGLAGTKEASQSSRILRSLFPESEIITGKELSKRYQALEDAIQRSTPEVQKVLSDFKTHLGNVIPSVLENSVVYNKIVPALKVGIQSDIKNALREIGLTGKEFQTLSSLAHSNAKNSFRIGLTPENFLQKIQNGELSREIAKKIMSVEDFLHEFGVDLSALQRTKKIDANILMDIAREKHANFYRKLEEKINARLAKHELKASEIARDKIKNLGKNLKKTYGMAEPISPPSAPIPPEPVLYPSKPQELPAIEPIQMPLHIMTPSPPTPLNLPQLLATPSQPLPLTPPAVPPLPPKPTLAPLPATPIPQTFIPKPEPMLAPAQGMAERAGDLLEENILGGTGLINNPLVKLGGLKYLLGKGALPIEGAYLGLKALTSPTALGEAARLTFNQAGIRAIESWASQYPSYHDGIVENPQERRSLTKQIEEAQDIPLEQKALLQSKVNRGIPLSGKL